MLGDAGNKSLQPRVGACVRGEEEGFVVGARALLPQLHLDSAKCDVGLGQARENVVWARLAERDLGYMVWANPSEFQPTWKF